jgi:Peptidase family M23
MGFKPLCFDTGSLRFVRLALCLLLLCGTRLCCQTPAPPVLAIQSAPERPIIESSGESKFLNFDLIVRNQTRLSLRITEIQLDVYDSRHHVVLRRSINTDALSPSIAVIGKQTVGPGEILDVFNPFYDFQSAVPLSELQFTFCLLRERNESERTRNLHRLPDDCDLRQQVSIFPRSYEDKTALVVPLHGRIFVWEGHDFYAHHLRVPLGNAKVKLLGITANSNNFANDFVYLDEQGRPYHDDPQKLENWFAYGKPVYAPGAGVVLAAANDIPENWFEDANATKIGHPALPGGKDPNDMGNFVMIDHQDGEYSLLIHLKPGSVQVRAGDRVSQGQQVGRIGFAGDTIFPHLHYSLMAGPEIFKSWGLPAYFGHFHRVLGTISVKENHATVNSGDFLESETTE